MEKSSGEQSPTPLRLFVAYRQTSVLVPQLQIADGPKGGKKTLCRNSG
jgi:hypothetical protein